MCQNYESRLAVDNFLQ